MTSLPELPLRPGLIPLDRDLVATFEVTRGSFVVPAALLAEDADPFEVARFFAQHLPERHPRATVITTRRALRDGRAEVTWRRVVVVVLPA